MSPYGHLSKRLTVSAGRDSEQVRSTDDANHRANLLDVIYRLFPHGQQGPDARGTDCADGH